MHPFIIPDFWQQTHDEAYELWFTEIMCILWKLCVFYHLIKVLNKVIYMFYEGWHITSKFSINAFDCFHVLGLD